MSPKVGEPVYERIDAPATPEQKAILSQLSARWGHTQTELAGDGIATMLTKAPGQWCGDRRLKVITEHGWFAARPSGTEDVYKLYAESFYEKGHSKWIQEEAKALVADALASPA